MPFANISDGIRSRTTPFFEAANWSPQNSCFCYIHVAYQKFTCILCYDIESFSVWRKLTNFPRMTNDPISFSVVPLQLCGPCWQVERCNPLVFFTRLFHQCLWTEARRLLLWELCGNCKPLFSLSYLRFFLDCYSEQPLKNQCQDTCFQFPIHERSSRAKATCCVHSRGAGASIEPVFSITVH